MGAELELTSSVFPADDQVRRYLAAQGREDHFQPLSAADGAEYDDVAQVDLAEIEPLIALPSSPGNVKPVSEVVGTPLDQVIVGSCNNSSYEDIALVARILRGKRVPDSVTLAITPGTSQVHAMLARSGELAELIEAGARILEPCCGPCIGMNLRPSPGTNSLRTYNRNFPNRSGTIGDQVYLSSPAVAAASALKGEIADPRELGSPPQIEPVERYPSQNGVIDPPAERGSVTIIYGPHHSPVPNVEPLPDTLAGRVLIVLGNEITTDDIMPAKPDTIASCANTQAMGQLVFTRIDPAFPQRALSWNGGFVVGGYNYGQGSSREHAVQGPLVLGVRAVVACSYARMHHDNLVNFGILPLVFTDPSLVHDIDQGDEWQLTNLVQAIRGGQPIIIQDKTHNRQIETTFTLTPRQVEILLGGGLLNTVSRELEEQ
jgi:aconitate hydratase